MNLGTRSAQMARDFTLKANVMFIRINMEEQKNSMNVNLEMVASIKKNAVQRPLVIEQFAWIRNWQPSIRRWSKILKPPKEVTTQGSLLGMNRIIQAEVTFGILKWDKSYKRLFRRGEKNVILEVTLISCGFNLYKYHNKQRRQEIVA